MRLQYIAGEPAAVNHALTPQASQIRILTWRSQLMARKTTGAKKINDRTRDKARDGTDGAAPSLQPDSAATEPGQARTLLKKPSPKDSTAHSVSVGPTDAQWVAS